MGHRLLGMRGLFVLRHPDVSEGRCALLAKVVSVEPAQRVSRVRGVVDALTVGFHDDEVVAPVVVSLVGGSGAPSIWSRQSSISSASS
jgi:hypothetical protein